MPTPYGISVAEPPACHRLEELYFCLISY